MTENAQPADESPFKKSRTEQLEAGLTIEWKPASGQPKDPDQVFRIVYGGLQGIAASMRSDERFHPHVLIFTRDEMGLLDLPVANVADDAGVRRLTEQLLPRVVKRRQALALALVTPSTENDSVVISIGGQGLPKFFSIPITRTPDAPPSPGDAEEVPNPNLYLKRIVTVPFDQGAIKPHS